MNCSDYILENIKLNNEIGELRAGLGEVVQAWNSYERQGAVSELEGQPLIYASVLEELADLSKRVLK